MYRPYVISIAGLDPSGGAGLLADIKCFEQHKVYGFAVCTALTLQNDIDFLQVKWIPPTDIIDQIEVLISRFQPVACKIGLIENIEVLLEVVTALQRLVPGIKIIVDPILKASTGFEFHDWTNALKRMRPILERIDLITPNYIELKHLGGFKEEHVYATAREWAEYCPVLLKGGHNEQSPGTDYLFVKNQFHTHKPGSLISQQKHGSGCVLSAAIVALLASGHSLTLACKLAKSYTEQFLNSNSSLLGYHSL